jgi:GNAT superfamily N-acetyltransferase
MKSHWEIIKGASVKDVHDIVDFQMEMALESENLVLNKSVVMKGVRAVLKDYWLVHHTLHQKNVACMLIQKEWSDWRFGVVLWIHSVYVIPEERNKGHFRRLYDELTTWAQTQQEENILGVRLYVDKRNEKALSVYKKLGMEDHHYTLMEKLF